MDSPKTDQIAQKFNQADANASNALPSGTTNTDVLNNNDNDDDESNYSDDDEYGLNSKRLKIDEEVDDDASTKPPDATIDKDEQANSNSSHDPKDQSQSLKVPPLKIICTKKDFGTPYLVVDNNAPGGSEPTSGSAEPPEANDKCDANLYSSASSTTSSGSSSSDSYLNENKTSLGESKIKQSSAKKDNKRQNQAESASKGGSAKKVNAQAPGSGRKASGDKNESNNMIRRKLRSHTRQHGPAEVASASTSKQKLVFDDIKQDGSLDALSEDLESNVSGQLKAIANERKRKQRQQAGGVEVLVEAASDVVCADKTSQGVGGECEVGCVTACPVGSNTAPVAAFFASNTNCIKKFIEIRSQISRRHDDLIQTKHKMSLPKNFDEFYLYKKNYLIESNKEARLAIPFYSVPNDVCDEMKEFYNRQEKERYNLRIRQKIEQDKLIIMYEQEVLRCFNRMSRDMNSHLSFCSIVNDDEVYNLKREDSNSHQKPLNNCLDENPAENLHQLKEMLTEVNLKFQRIKDDLIKRQLNECDSLYAVQRMDWQSKLREISNAKVLLNNLNEIYVPMVDVNSKLELTPVHI